MLYRENPRAVRVRPSQGDGGIDVLIPNEQRAGAVDVYQIKKFAENLTSSQKSQIEGSYRRLAEQVSSDDTLIVENWYLLMPLDPTPQNQKWFNGMPGQVLAKLENEAAGLKKAGKSLVTKEQVRRIREWQEDPANSSVWKGLIACESLVADHPSVIDYYLYGGRDRIESTVRQVASLLSTDRELRRDSTGPDVQPIDLKENLRNLQGLLDMDPHFRYGVSLDPNTPELLPEEDLVAATQETDPEGRCLTFRIYTRFDEALNQRPVPVKLNFAFAADSPESQAYDKWRKYGRPTTLPAKITMDLPGGLGGEYLAGQVSIGVPPDRKPYRIRHRLVAADGTPLADITLNMEPATVGPGGNGSWMKGADAAGGSAIECSVDFEGSDAQITTTFGDFTGSDVDDALAVARFLSHWASGNKLEVAGEKGRFFPFMDLGTVTEAPLGEYVLRALEAMSTIQTRITQPIHVPDFFKMTKAELAPILDAAALVAGQELIGTWSETKVQRIENFEQEDVECEILVLDNYAVKINGKELFLGVSSTNLTSARFSFVKEGCVLVPAYNDRFTRRLDVNADRRPPNEPNIKYRRIFRAGPVEESAGPS
jgi:hypothetical protein